MLTLKAALLFNGVWRTVEEAQRLVEERNKKYGDPCGEVEYLEKSSTDEDVLSVVTGNLNLGRY